MLLDKQLIADSNGSALKEHQRKFSFTAEGISNTEEIIKKLMAFQVAIPSWALGTGGTRFGRFAGAGEPGSLEEKINSVVPTPDGGMLILGYTNSNDGDITKTHALIDIWLTKLDANGTMVWNKTIGGSDDDYGASIIATSDGNYIIAGYSGSNDGDVPANIGFHDFYVSKITGEGTIIWSKNYGFISHDHAHKIIQTSDGGYFIAGYADYAGIDGSGGTGNNGEGHSMRNGNATTTAKHGVGEFFGIKITSTGDFSWYRYYGGTMNDRVNDIVEADDGGLIMVGYSESTNFDITNNKGSYDYWVIKLHKDGALHWKENYGGSGIDQAFGVTKTGNNSYLIVGRSNSTDGQISNPKGNFDGWVIHINDHGHLLWEKSFGGADFDVATTIRKISNGNFVVVGNSRGTFEGNQNKGENDFWLFEIDNKANSNMYWQKTFGGSNIDIATDFYETPNKNIIVVGESQSSEQDVPYNKGSNDLWVIKVK